MESRRKFLTTIIAVGVPAGILALAPSGQLRAQRPQNPEQQKEKEDDSHMPKFDPKLILAANQKEIKKNVEKLYDLASELKLPATGGLLIQEIGRGSAAEMAGLKGYRDVVQVGNERLGSG